MNGDAAIPTEVQLWRLSDLQLLQFSICLKVRAAMKGWAPQQTHGCSPTEKLFSFQLLTVGSTCSSGLDGPSPASASSCRPSRESGTPAPFRHRRTLLSGDGSGVECRQSGLESGEAREVSRVVWASKIFPHWMAIEPGHRRVNDTGYGDPGSIACVLANFDEATGG